MGRLRNPASILDAAADLIETEPWHSGSGFFITVMAVDRVSAGLSASGAWDALWAHIETYSRSGPVWFEQQRDKRKVARHLRMAASEYRERG